MEQAGFGKGFSTLSYLQVIATLVEIVIEYNIDVWILFVDYEKVFN